ncbi:MAG: biotin--[acetyl-CoA-carboxylase] ligase [Chloroflexota bacterium]
MQTFQPLWRTRHVAITVRAFEVLASTQREACECVATGQADGLLVMADEQTNGRGRLGRAWQSPPGNLYLSLVLKPPPPIAGWPRYTLLAALALADAIESVCDVPPSLKWPNDVLVRGRKVAGILAEVVDERLVLGVGVNVNAPVPTELPHATSLRDEVGHEVERARLLQAFVEQFDAHYDESLHGARFMSRCAARMETLGREVRVQMGAQTITGIAESVTDDGALIVRQADDSRIVCHAGEVTLRA